MLPLSTGNTKGCTPISSNCIVWQGPDLNCLNICTGDTISVVVAKMAELLCNLITTGIEAGFDITGIIQGCTALGTNPPATTLQELLQNMINVECNLQNTVNDIVTNINFLTETIEELDTIVGPQGNDGPQGDPGIQGPPGTSVVDTVDLGDGTFYFVYSDGTTSDPIEVPTNTTVIEGDDITNETTIETTVYEQLEVPVVIPKCIYTEIGELYDNTGDDAFQMLDGATMMLYTGDNESYYEENGNGDTIYYNGWIDFVNKKLCCIIPGAGCDDQGVAPPPNGGRDEVTNSKIQNLPFITQLKNRVVAIERKGGTSVTAPKVTVKCIIPNKIGRRVEMQELLSALERDYCQYKKAVGNTKDILTAARYQCTNLSAGDRLSGNGVMSTLQGWNTKPSSLAQSFSNAWKTICDLRTAVEDLQTTVIPSACNGFIYNPKVNIKKNSSGVVTGLSISFSDCTIPSGYYDCDKGKGTKITVEDSSLNTLSSYVNVTQLSTGTSSHDIGFGTYNMDLTSNYKVKFHFCFTDGANQCERIMEMTMENTSSCPTITISTTNETSIEYSISGLSTVSNSIYSIIVEDVVGNVISKQSIKNPTSSTSTGKAGGLIAGTKYNIYTEVTATSGNVSTCAKSAFTTAAPTCTTYSKLSTDYVTKISDLAGTKTTMATLKNGTVITAWIAGFSKDTGEPAVYKGTDSGITDPSTTSDTNRFRKLTRSISDNPTTSINCGNVVYSATGMTTTMNSNENGWQYVDSLKQNGNTTYYIYALVNTATKSINQVVFCCDCKPSYVRPRYGKVLDEAGNLNPNSQAYRPDRHAYYVIPGQDLRIPIDIIGYSKQTTPINWVGSSTLGGTTKFLSLGDTGYDTNLGGEVQLIYTPNGTRPAGGTDSIDVYAKTDCTVGNEGNKTINTVTIPIVDAAIISNQDTNITVFIDANMFSEAEALQIKSSFESFKGAIQSSCSDWTGTINYVPVIKGGADYLEHTKAMVDKKAGGTGSITVASGYSGFTNLPSYWGASSTLGIPSSVYIVSFIGDCNSNGNYGASTLLDGWNSPAQPTAAYQKNYDELCDILNVHGGAPRSIWGTNNGCTFKQFKLKQIIVPVVSGSQDGSAAAVLQSLGALTGTVLSDQGLKGLATGSVQNPVNVNDYMGPNASMMVPYTGTTSYGANTINGLYELGFRVAPFIDKSYLSEDGNIYSSGSYNIWVENLMKAITGIDTAGVGLISDKKCPSGTDLMKPMKGDLNGADIVTYGEEASCRTAGTRAETATNCIPIYNETGVMFDTTVPAYKTISGGNVGAGALTNAKWYAQKGSSSTNSVRRVAQYNASGSGGYWINIQYVGDASCV